MKIALFLWLAVATHAQTVVIFAVDGLGANVLRAANLPPNFAKFKAGSAYSFEARGVMPTVTFPNFASMLSGAGPEQHGVTSNDWRPDKFTIPPMCQGKGGHFPTIFGLLRERRPDAKMALFFDGDGFPFIVEEGVADKIGTGKGSDATLAMAIEYIVEQKPALVFLHLDLMDHAGHTEGFDSPVYADELLHCDRLLGKLIAAVGDKATVLISSDHGGVGKRHGGNSMTEIEIPWLLRGPGIATGKGLTTPINTFDTASTIARIFGLTQPACWLGRPVDGAFVRR